MIYPSYNECDRELDRCLPTWTSQVREGEHTPSDLQWCGIVDEPLPYWLRGPRRDLAKHNNAWRQMIARAKSDIDTIDAEWRVKRLAAACTPADVEVFLKGIT